MGVYYEVKQGEHVTRIAMNCGFSDWRPVWMAPENADLRAKRTSPDVLLPGDLLFVPDLQSKELAAATEKKHVYEVNVKPLRLRVRLLDRFDVGVTNTDCILRIGSDSLDVTTDGTASFDQLLNMRQRKEEAGSVQFDETLDVNTRDLVRKVEIPFKLGYMDPVDQEAGQLKRLRNLAYYPLTDETPDTKPDAKLFQAAVEEFQCENNLTVDGICGPQTQAKLKEVYGC